MKIFIDSAKLSEIEKAYCCGVLDGVTTNPTLIREAMAELGKTESIEDYIKSILIASRGTPVSLEVTSQKYRDIVREGENLFRRFRQTSENIYLKIPVNPSVKAGDGHGFDGLHAINTLSSLGIPINCTLVFTPEQALMAAKAGAEIISTYVGRIDDSLRKDAGIEFDKKDYFPQEGIFGKDDNGVVSGVDLVLKTVELFDTHGIDALILAASIRNTRQAREVALAGADIATLPLNVIKELTEHQKTREGIGIFGRDTLPEYAALGGE